jgi:hypothetical protein
METDRKRCIKKEFIFLKLMERENGGDEFHARGQNYWLI